MSEMISSYISGYSTAFFLRQCAVIILMFAIGSLILLRINKGRISLYELLLAFPTGISAYSLSVFILLVAGIPFNRISVGCILLAIVIICFAGAGKYAYIRNLKQVKPMVCLITLLCITAVSVSGLLPVGVSNDSLYYYSMYPHAITHFGVLRTQFNVFLTDVGQTSAILNTLPFLFGYNEGFGVQWFLNINTLLIVIYGLYDSALTVMERKEACMTTAVLTGILVFTMPYLVMTRWVMSNGYFMSFVFICMYTAWRYGNLKENGNSNSCGNRAVLAVLFPMMALMRMEGCIVALIMVLCLASLKGYEGRELFVIFLLPILVVSVLYDVRIFEMMNIDAPYTFLSKSKALIQIAAIIIVSGYVLFIRGKSFLKLNEGSRLSAWLEGNRYLYALIPVGLVCINVILSMMNKTLYSENMKTFAANVSNQSGWGLFPMLIIGIYVMCFIAGSGKGLKDTVSNASGMAFWDLCFVSYILTAIAVSFARDDALVENVADSGNRVMLQVILIAFYAVSMHLIALAGNKAETDA